MVRPARAAAFVAVGLLSVASVPSSSAAPIRLARHPDYHAGRITFSYLGDIWIANEDGSGVVRMIKGNDAPLEALRSGEVNVLGGTAWLWSREAYAGAVDVLGHGPIIARRATEPSRAFVRMTRDRRACCK